MTDTPRSAQDERDAEVVSRHLPIGYSADPDVISNVESSSVNNDSDSRSTRSRREAEDSLKLQGGDVHRDIFRIKARAKQPQRSATFSEFSRNSSRSNEEPQAEQRAPGGFRRQFLLQQSRRLSNVTAPVTGNFVSFLDLYGGFAGEDLFESDDESAVEDESENDEETSRPRSNERRPLLGARRSSRAAKKGDASMTKTFFTLIKAFIGTGIMFLPKAFNNGGILFSSITMLVVSLVSCVSFHLLLECRAHYGGGYGELGAEIGGPKLRSLILASIFISQIGFVCAGIIFTAENLYSFAEAVAENSTLLNTKALIAIQVAVLVPLALIRNISKLGPAALVADIFIAIGLIYIYYYDISALASQGIASSVQLFNPSHYTLTIGSAIFTFEGIGLILPIQSSMKEPEKFSRLLYTIMLIITIIFTSVGALSYATFGNETRTEIISNYPQDSSLVNAVQFLYSLAVLVGTPVQLFPAVRILETKCFGHRTGKQSLSTKWKKNAFRTAIVLACAGISILGASDLDKFVALIGSFACVPLVYIYPALLHYKGVAKAGSAWAVADVVLMIVGLVAMVYTTAVTVWRWGEE